MQAPNTQSKLLTRVNPYELILVALLATLGYIAFYQKFSVWWERHEITFLSQFLSDSPLDEASKSSYPPDARKDNRKSADALELREPLGKR